MPAEGGGACKVFKCGREIQQTDAEIRGNEDPGGTLEDEGVANLCRMTRGKSFAALASSARRRDRQLSRFKVKDWWYMKLGGKAELDTLNLVEFFLDIGFPSSTLRGSPLPSLSPPVTQLCAPLVHRAYPSLQAARYRPLLLTCGPIYPQRRKHQTKTSSPIPRSLWTKNPRSPQCWTSPRPSQSIPRTTSLCINTCTTAASST